MATPEYFSQKEAENLSQIGRNGAVSANLVAMGSMVAWAMGFPAAEVLLERFDVVTVTAGRFAVASLLLVAVWLVVDGVASARGLAVWRAMGIGALGFGGGAGAILTSQAVTDPVTVAIFASMTPLCAMVVARVFEGQRFGSGFFIGMIFALVGGVVATGAGLPGDYGLGAAMALVSSTLFCWGTLATVRAMPEASNLTRTTITALGALIVFLVLAIAGFLTGLTPWPVGGPTGREALSVLVYGAFGFALSQILWMAGAARLGVALASFHINIAPFYAMLILLALGGAWLWPQAWGAAIVGVGAVIAQVWPASGQVRQRDDGKKGAA